MKTFWIYYQNKPIKSVRMAEWTSTEMIKEKALWEAYMLGESADLAPYIRAGEIRTFEGA